MPTMPALLLALAGFVMLAGSATALLLAEEKAVVIPPPAADEAAGQKSSEVAVLAGAKAVQITFDPRQVSYGRLLQVFFSVAHDPTQLNRQGPDVGTQYRSAIFPANPEQDRVARAYIEQLNQARVFKAALVTKVELDRPFFPAERYHQDFLIKNPRDPYIVINDLPKRDGLKKVFPDLYRSAPVLVSSR